MSSICRRGIALAALIALVATACTGSTRGALSSPEPSPSAASYEFAFSSAPPLPGMEEAAREWKRSLDARIGSAEARIVEVRSGQGSAQADCAGIPEKRFLLTSPVPLPAVMGEQIDGDGVVFRVPAGTLVRAPVGGNARVGPASSAVTFVTITTGGRDVQIGVPKQGVTLRLPGHRADRYYERTIRRGDPVAEVGEAAAKSARPFEFVGAQDYNVRVRVQTSWSDVPPYGGGEQVQLRASGPLWFGGVPTACSGWPVAALATSTAAPVPSPTLSPAGSLPPLPGLSGKIAFTYGYPDQKIAVVDLSSGRVTQVPDGNWRLPWPNRFKWHPDGRRLIFSSGRRLLLLNPVTGVARAVPNLPADVVAEDWSPDGSRFAWITEQALYVGDGANRNPKRIYRGDGLREVAWSPDGSRLLIETATDVLLLNRTGGPAARMTAPSNSGDGTLLPGTAAWSRDGSMIALIRLPEEPGLPPALCSVPVSSLKETCIQLAGARLLEQGSPVVWLPDNRRVLVPGWVVDTASGGATKFVSSLDAFHLPLSADGEYLAITLDRDYWAPEVYVLRVATQEVVARATFDFEFATGLDWAA